MILPIFIYRNRSSAVVSNRATKGCSITILWSGIIRSIWICNILLSLLQSVCLQSFLRNWGHLWFLKLWHFWSHWTDLIDCFSSCLVDTWFKDLRIYFIHIVLLLIHLLLKRSWLVTIFIYQVLLICDLLMIFMFYWLLFVILEILKLLNWFIRKIRW